MLAKAHQVYWRLRAIQLQEQIAETGTDKHITELIACLDEQERRIKRRKERARWIWALACFAALIGVYAFPRLAMVAHIHGGAAFYGYAFMGPACLALFVIAF